MCGNATDFVVVTMGKGHIAILFLIIACYCYLGIEAERERYLQVAEEKRKIEESLLYAISATAWEMTGKLEEGIAEKLYVLEESFFRAWFVRLGISDNEEKKEQMKMYLPLIAWLEEDGSYFYFLEEKNEGGEQRIVPGWSAGAPYTLTGDNKTDKQFLTEYLENQVSGIISEHNHIAKNMGINYEFSVPYFLANQENIQFPMLLVVFQGWPLEGSGKILYENCIDANAVIYEK